MSDQPGNPSDAGALVAIANEYRRLQRQIESKSQQLDSLLETNGEAGSFPTDFEGVRNRRYSIDFPFVPGQLVPQERAVTVETGTVFRCAAIESCLRVSGTGEDPYSLDDVTVQVTLPWSQRLLYFDYLWSVRDTGTDREWMNVPQPSLFGGGGYLGPLWFPRRVVLGGGTSIFTDIQPFLSLATPLGNTFFGGGSVVQYIVQVSFIGHEVPDRSAL